MAQLRDALASKAGRVAMAAALLLGVVTVAPVFSGAASAHKADVSAEVYCDGTVSWTVKSWSRDEQGSNPDVRVMEHHDGTSDQEVGKGSFDSSDGYQFSGHFQWPDGATVVVVSSKPRGEWGSGHETDDSDQMELVKPADCDHHPEVGKVVECENSAPGDGDGTVDLTLTNPSGPFGHPADFEVDSPDHEGSVTYHLAAGDHQHVVYHHLADGHHTMHVKVGDKDMSQDVEVHCDQSVPSVTKSQACVAGDGAITVNLANTGGAAVMFEVENPTTHAVETITLQPSQNTSRTFSGLADGEYTVKVTAGEMDLSQHFEVKCDGTDVKPPDECSTDDHSTDGHSSTSAYSEQSTSTTVDDHHHCRPPAAQGRIEVAKACVNQDGQVTVTLIAMGAAAADPVHFVVEGQSYTVQAGTTRQVVLSGLTDGEHTIHVSANGHDLSFEVSINCDLSPRVTVTQSCVAFHGSVSLLLENLGDDESATFTINGIDHVVAAGASATVVIDGLPDGANTITLSINGMKMPDIVVSFSCAPVFHVVAECNTVSPEGVAQTYWYTITNTESTDIEVSWDLGTVVVPAGESRTIGSNSATLSLMFQGTEIATAAASDVACSRPVTFVKGLIGAPANAERYSVKVSRLVGDTFVDIITFDLVAGTPKTINLPSTLDPAGIEYKIVEVARGTASTSVVTPDTLTLSGNLGESVNVTITNGYAGVRLDKHVSDAQVGIGTQFSYTLAATNTGGLTLDPVVVLDRLPTDVSFVSAAVADGGGTCALDQTGHPQLVKCTMSAPLVAAATTPTVTITVTVDATATVGGTIQNQGKVVGAFGPAATLSEAVGAPLSCTPVVDGTVCALSAVVGAAIVQSAPPVPPTTTPGPTTTVRPGGPLPGTGSNSLPLVFIAVGLAGLGAVLLRARRRPIIR